MAKPHLVLVFAFALLLLGCITLAGGVSIGVKRGDWIEYHVVTTGTPQEGHDVTWARMEILEVQGTEVKVNVTTRAANGTLDIDIMTLNPGKGEVGVWFIIPADLNVGDSFYDASEDRNVTVEGSQQRTIAGATRTVMHASTTERLKSWDRTTGVFVESIDVLSNYTLNATAYSTNLWSEQTRGVDAVYIYVAMGALVVVAVIAVVFFVVRARRK